MAEHEGRAVGGLSGYDSAKKGMDQFIAALTGLLQARHWSPEHQQLLTVRIVPVTT